MCDTQAYVRASQSPQCEECKRKCAQAVEPPEVRFVDPWPECRPPFIRSKCRDHDAKVMEKLPFSEEDMKMSVQSSKVIAAKLADFGEIGFESMRTENHSSRRPRDVCIYHQAIERLAFIANNREVPYENCVAAARCGGLPLYPGRLPEIEQTPMLADVDDATYGAVVRKLIRCTNIDSAFENEDAVCSLMRATDHRLACYYRAALAAALMVYTFENDTNATKMFTPTDVQGGRWGSGDIPTRHEYVPKLGSPMLRIEVM